MNRKWSVGLAIAVVAFAGSSARAAEPSTAMCTSPAVGKSIPFGVGEKLEYEIDSLGAEVGTFSMKVGSAAKPNAYTVIVHGQTSNVAASFYSVEATAESYLGKALENRRYVEDALEAKIKRTIDVTFPPGNDQKLAVKATRQGTREDASLTAPADTRDMLGALYAVRTLPLVDGAQLCFPIFGAKRLWTLRMKVEGKETIRAPAGEFKTIHLTGTATRTDTPQQTREIQFWFSDDASRIPVAALGVIQGKPVRAQLVQYTPGRHPSTHGRRLQR